MFLKSSDLASLAGFALLGFVVTVLLSEDEYAVLLRIRVVSSKL